MKEDGLFKRRKSPFWYYRLRLNGRWREISTKTSYKKKKLFATAATNPHWISAHSAALISANTTARGCDLLSLKWSDMDWFEQAMSITDSKTEAGVRRVPLNTDAMLGFRILKERASKLGIDGPNSYVFPACEHWHFDPTRPQKSWRSA